VVTFYVDGVLGSFIGAYPGEHSPPAGGVPVQSSPPDYRQLWDFAGQSWGPVPAVVPQVVTMQQARLALHAAGRLADVDTVIAAMPEPPRVAAQIAWSYASEVRRDSNLVSVLGGLLVLTDAEIDALFMDAAGR
jgi:hypothetical protein